MDKIRTNIIIGRFQPLTDGHMKCIDEAWKKLGVGTVICLVDTPDNKVDKRHPFPTSVLAPIYNDLKSTFKNINDIVIVDNADIVKIGKALENKYEIVSWSCGTDRIDSYTKMSTKYKDEAGLSDDFQMIEIKRTNEDISATRVRQALLDGDIKTFNKLTPYNTLSSYIKEPNKVYNILREKILQVN
jgi:nicotinamide mononucleotide adenylyltransferase